MVREALDSYRRMPGLDDPSLIYETSIGREAFRMLQISLDNDNAAAITLAVTFWLRAVPDVGRLRLVMKITGWSTNALRWHSS
jgi:hypothetical protein